MKKRIQKVFAIFIVLTLSFGFYDLKAQSTIADNSNQEVKNLSAFAKSYGYIRFFYPNTQTEDFNWEAFLVYGTLKVKNLKTDEELMSVLSDLFSPIAPYAVFGNKENTKFKVKPISNGDSITFWQHRSISITENMGAKMGGDDIKILVTTAFDSSKVIEPNNPFLQDKVQFQHVDYSNKNQLYYPDNYLYSYDPKINNKYILKKQPDPSQPFSSKLANNIWITMPIVLSNQEAEHLTQESEIEKFSNVLEKFYANEKAIYLENDIWYADFILAWNAIHHLYPYRKRSEKMFNFQSSEQLVQGLNQISNATNKKNTSYRVVRNYVSLLRDPHANVFSVRTPDKSNQNSNAPKTVYSWLPFYRIYSQGKVYVLKSFDPKIKNGDELLEINNNEVSVFIDSRIKSGLESPQLNLRSAVNSIGLFTNTSKSIVKLKRDDEILTVEVNTIPPKEYIKHYTNPFEHKPFEYPNPKTIYIKPSLVSSKDLSEKFDEILKAEHLIFDLRSYPKAGHVIDIFDHLQVVNNLGKGLILSSPLNMYPNQEQQYHIWRSILTIPEKPFINAKISVLIGSSTISRGETFASYFKYTGATLIGDGNTAGASGGIAWFTTPSNIRINLTSSYTVRQNGEEMQTVGIAPDILVKHSLEGLKEGKDQVYEAALERTRQK